MLRTKTAPFVRSGVVLGGGSPALLLAMLLALALSCLIYGFRPALLALVGMVSAALPPAVYALVTRRKFGGAVMSAAVHGLGLVLLLPASAPYWMALVGGLLSSAILLALGGDGNSPFHPIAVGASILTLCWGERMFAYPVSGEFFDNFLPLWDASDVPLGISPALSLQNGAVPADSLMKALTGQAASAIGTGFILVLGAILLYLSFRRAVYFSSAVSFLGGVAVLALLFPRISAGGLFPVYWELASGSVMFFAAFVIGDRRYAPKFLPSRIVLGLLAAVICVVLRRAVAFEQAACFAVLAVNALTPLSERTFAELLRKEDKRDDEADTGDPSASDR